MRISMTEYSKQDVTDLFNTVLTNIEQDLVHHIKHNKTNYDDYVQMLRVLDKVKAGINHQLEEELNGK